MKDLFFKNITYILDTGMIENIKLKNIDILKSIFNDNTLKNKLYKNFVNNYKSLHSNSDMLFTKTNDFMYRLNMIVNDCLIKNHKINDKNEIKDILNELVNKDIDLYSAVSYDFSDNEIIKEFEDVFSYNNITI